MKMSFPAKWTKIRRPSSEVPPSLLGAFEHPYLWSTTVQLFHNISLSGLFSLIHSRNDPEPAQTTSGEMEQNSSTIVGGSPGLRWRRRDASKHPYLCHQQYDCFTTAPCQFSSTPCTPETIPRGSRACLEQLRRN